MSEDQIWKKKNNWKNQIQNTLFDAQNNRPDGLTRDLKLRPTHVSKVIGTKHEKYFMFIFNSKAKILIKKVEWNLKKKTALGNTCVFFIKKTNKKSHRKWEKNKKYLRMKPKK